MILSDGRDIDLEEELRESEDDIERYEPCGLLSRQAELDALGEAQDRSKCFGCVYMGEREQTAIPYKDLMDLIEMGRKAMGRCHPVTLAKEMARRYRVLRREINKQVMPGERPLPEWKASTILEHIRSHNQDPETQMWVTLCEIKELKEAALEGAVEYNKGTKRKRVNDKQVSAYEKLVKLEMFVYNKKPQDMWGYSAGGHLDPKSMNQGMLALSGKPVVSLWQNAKRHK